MTFERPPTPVAIRVRNTTSARRRRPHAGTAAVLAGVIAGSILAGCATIPLQYLRGDEVATYSQEQLRADLVSLANAHELGVTSAAEAIKKSSPDRQIRENALRWQMVVLPRIRRLVYLPDPKKAYLAMLIVAHGLGAYFETGDGRELFGDQQIRAVEVSRELEAETREIGRNFLSPSQQRALEDDVDEIVRTHPIRGTFAPESLVAAVHHSASRESMGWIVRLPMVPVRALTGVSDTAQAIHEFTDAARYLTDVAAGLPQEMRWQTEMLLYDVEDRESVASALAGWDNLSDGAQRLAAAADRLPHDMRAETDRLFLELERQQQDLQKTLVEVRSVIADVEVALRDAGELAAPYGELASKVGGAGDSWTAMLREIRAMQGPDEPASERSGGADKGFDIGEYEATAREVNAAAAGVRDLLRELRELVDAPQLTTTVAALAGEIDRAEAGGRDVVDHAAWRAFQLLLFFFAGLAIVRLVAPRRP